MKEKCRYDKCYLQSAKNSRQKIFLSCVYCFLFAFILTSCKEIKKESEENILPVKDSLTYYCPMHPEIVQHHPGKCPKPECKGMELVVKASENLLEKTLKPVNSTVLASIKTTKPVYQKIHLNIEATGYLDFDTRTMSNVSSLYSGRIEKLYVKYEYQQIHAGQILFEIYSPELVSAQQNLIYVLNNDPDEKNIIESAEQKLILLGLPKKLVKELEKTRKVMMAVPVYSKYGGHIHPVMDMSSSQTNVPMEDYKENKKLPVKEGMYVMAGQTIFNIVNPHKLAAVLQIKSKDIAHVSKGQKVEMIMEDNKMTMRGKIDFIDPFFMTGAKTMTAKVYVENAKHNHRVGSLLKAKIEGGEFDALWIPTSALVDLGNEKIVWIKRSEKFVAQKVETRIIANGMIEIEDGLTEADEIALEAHYLIDSESFIKVRTNEN